MTLKPYELIGSQKIIYLKMAKVSSLVSALVLFCSLWNKSWALMEQIPSVPTMGTPVSTMYRSSSQLHASSEIAKEGDLEVVLFGIGDLRVDDHEGLKKAMEAATASSSVVNILPIAVLDKSSLSKVPGAIAHTIATSSLIVEALGDLKLNLEEKNLALHVAMGGNNMSERLSAILEPYLSDNKNVRIHVCDLGDADNNIGYAPINHLNDLPGGILVLPWSCHLRNEPWSHLETLPTTFTTYEQLYTSDPIKPFDANKVGVDKEIGLILEDITKLPHTNEVVELFQETLSLDDEKCLADVNIGLFGTHWGGLESSSVGETKVLKMIKTYVEACGEDDKAFAKVPLACARNGQSLEHAVMAWNMRGDGGSVEEPDSDNLIPGERLTRFLLAPLLLGTVSPRRIWYSLIKDSLFFKSPFKTFMESYEWHKLFAARNIRTSKNEGNIKYKYWRWHGLLCRYLESDLHPKSDSTLPKEGLLLIHGFGASGSQFIKLIGELSKVVDSGESNVQCLAPDLIGFGQAEKPPITYSGYGWESFTSDFIKEVVDVDSFIVVGNSIGGFISICTAANDHVPLSKEKRILSGNGGLGTGKCSGAVLMSPAGVIQTEEEVSIIEQQAAGALLQSVAQVTATDSLSVAKPFPRPIARAFGTGLLRYLRPRVGQICVNLYPTNPKAVDDTLCETILRDSLDPGAINVMISGSKLPTPRTWNEVVAAEFGQSNDLSLGESTFTGPILMAQGVLDPLNDFKTRAQNIKKLRDGVTVDELQAGHCPHDEVPEEVARSIDNWMKKTRSERIAFIASKKKESAL